MLKLFLTTGTLAGVFGVHFSYSARLFPDLALSLVGVVMDLVYQNCTEYNNGGSNKLLTAHTYRAKNKETD